MRALIDSSAWSEYLRRRAPLPSVDQAVRSLIDRDEAILIGPVRQELLSGVRERSNFLRLRTALSQFPDEPILATDYEDAAACCNQCRIRGVQGSATDFLVCAISTRLPAEILTLDHDFQAIAEILPIRLYRL